jgi:hypothetical protein
MAEKIEYELTEAEAAVLSAATEEAGAAAGALGGSIGGAIGGGGAGRAGGRSGGASGGRFGARFTKAQTAVTTVEASHDPHAARERARTSIAESGAVIEDPNASGDGSVWGLVGSGAMNMAPALVRVAVEAAGSSGSRIHVRATGREGLIKQRVGAKAADRIAEAVARVE